ncbi:molybdopterin-dependent oxidoreductase [Cryobacterium psychrotolerans]|uniref:molybdopterin-dependent oxidoreductase n=1 Tax=Cryobacterium psychrotolerans TaxID=386301 RepID=UPI003F749B52
MAGVAAALAGLGLAELTAGLFAPNAGPILAIGALIIDLSPAWLKDLVISLFGTADKAVLIVCVGLAAALLSAVAGVLEFRRPPAGRVIAIVFGSLAVFAAVTRANATAIDALPSVVAMVVTAVLITVFATKFRVRPAPAEADQAAGAIDRRRFLAWTGVSAGVGILAAVGGQLLQAGARAADAARARLTLPAPAVPAAPIPAGASVDVPGLAPLITPNDAFYRIDTALRVPRIDASQWTLKVTGMVENEIEIDFVELLALPLEESTTTLACVSNEVGGDLIGNATWLGYPIRKLLARARPTSDADMVLSRSQDGWTASTPLDALTDDRNAILAVGMNGVALPLEHGYPVRMVVPGLYGYVSATKWVVELKLTRFDREVAYWSTRGWSERGPIKLSSRIDVPRAGAPVASGPVTVAGVAWAQHTGIRAVEVQVDDGDWNTATLADAISADTWRQWKWSWDAPAGEHTLRVRATDADGLVQTSARRAVAPDGATGLHDITVRVG